MQYVEATVEAVAKSNKKVGSAYTRGVLLEPELPGSWKGWCGIEDTATAASLKKGQRVKVGYTVNGKYTNYKTVEVIGGTSASSGGKSYSGGGSDNGLRIARQSSLNRVVDLVVADKIEIKGKTNGEKLAQMLQLSESIANWVENGPKKEASPEPEPTKAAPVVDLEDDEVPF